MSLPFTVKARQRVIYGDTDQMGVVYYANYLRYFELGRLEYFAARGGNYSAMEAAGLGLPVVQANVEYHASAKYEDVVLISTHVSEVRRVSLTFDYEIHREAGGQRLCSGFTVHACVSKAGRPTRLPAELVALLTS